MTRVASYEPMSEDIATQVSKVLQKDFDISVKDQYGKYKSLFQVLCELSDICKSNELNQEIQNLASITGGNIL